MPKDTIIIIDDDNQTVGLLNMYAQKLGFKTECYTHPSNFFALKNIELFNRSIAILDLNMPGMDGIEVMRNMVNTTITMPIILLSGFDKSILHSAEQLAKAHNLEIISSLSKPISFNVFKKTINKYNSIPADKHKNNNFEFSVSELKNSIIDDQIILYYQPQITISNQKLIGVEALVRWNHPLFGIIKAKHFIDEIEKNGLINELSNKVLKLSFKHANFWKSQNIKLRLSLNISPDNITSLSLPEQLIGMLQNKHLETNMLTLEVTESVLMGKLTTTLDILTRLRLKGIKLSIDDFGTGYSSLSQLYKLPFNELKIDKSFVINMAHNEDAKGIVRMCINLGHELNMQVVAEGVENKDTYDLLKEMDCDIAQGYYISKPMPEDQLMSWAKNYNTDHS